MRLGISVPTRHSDGRLLSSSELALRAVAIEEAGFDSIWIGESINRGNFAPDPLMWLLIAAAVTSHVEIGVAILQLPLRNPTELATRLLTIHALTGGRFTLGVGAGSTEADFEACSVDFAERFHIFDRYLPLVRKLCQGEVVGSANLKAPENARGGPPVMIGSWNSKLWIRRAATQYEGWLASGRADTNQFQTLGENLKMFRDLGGKRVAIATVGIDLTQPNKRLAPDEAFSLRCGPESAMERLQMVAGMGVDDVFLAAQPTR